MFDIIVLAAIAALVLVGVVRMKAQAEGKRSCCSDNTCHPQKTFRSVSGIDTDPCHYAHHTKLTIQGMTCEACEKRVKRALEHLGSGTTPSVFAEVDADTNTAFVHSKEPLDTQAAATVVYEAGYRLLESEAETI